jgi:hypothetical protein
VSPLPGVSYETRDSSGVSGPPLDTATAFVGGLAERGPVDKPRFCTTLPQFEAIYGGEVSYGWLWWAAKLIPQEGGAGCWFQRVVGPAAKASTVKLTDGSKNTLQVDAVSPGAWGDDIDVKTEVGGGNVTYTVVFKGVNVEVSPALATNADAVAWALNSEYVRFTDLGGADPTAQTGNLAGGDDDRASITDEHRKAGQALFTDDLGPGQELFPGATTTVMHTALLVQSLARDRAAVLDGADTHTVATHLAECATLRALGFPADAGSPFGPWPVVPGPAPGTTKAVPPSIIEAAKMARRDLETFDPVIGVGNPNEPAAGVHNNAGVSRTAVGLSQEAWTDTEREALNNAGFNVLRVLYGQVVTYGYRTLANPVTRPLNVWLSNRRLDMAILAKARAIGEEFNFRQIDGRGRMLNEFGAALAGRVLMPYWEIGALFGDTPEDAFGTETGDQVNPPEQLEEGLVKAEIEAKRSPLAERVKLIYVKEEL